MCETTILGGGPAGTGPPVWAARRYPLLGAWLDSGVAIVEQRRWLGGPPGRCPLNADSLRCSFLERLNGPIPSTRFPDEGRNY
jgi:hypothetical protein